MEAIDRIARSLQITTKNFSYAGTKDKRAFTTQAVHCFKQTPQKLKEVIERDRKHFGESSFPYWVGNFSYRDEQLTLGKLKGNRFTIVLRNVETTEENAETGLRLIEKYGFINYYGMQRFGTGGIPTYEVGKALLKREWDKAVTLLLMPGGEDREGQSHGCADQAAKARQYFKDTRDVEGTLRILPKWMSVERRVLQALKDESRNDFCNAIFQLPRNMRLMYVHAFQSYVWNHMVTARFQLNPTAPMVGDLVLDAKTPIPKKEDEKTENDEEEEVVTSGVKILTEEDLPNYTLADVVLPLPGQTVQYPTHIIGTKYKEFLEKEGITSENFYNQASKDFCLSGGYRKILAMPTDFKWKHFRYNNMSIPLTYSDIDELNKLPQPQSIPDGEKYALRLEFSLPSSTYATMLLRELLKRPTTKTYQVSKNEPAPKAKDGEGDKVHGEGDKVQDGEGDKVQGGEGDKVVKDE